MRDELDVWRQAKDEFVGALRLAKRYRGRLQQLVKELDPDQQAALQAEWDSEQFSKQEQEVLQWLEP